MVTKKYLIVCGGSGKYVLGQRRVLGLDGEIQLDVSEEIKSTREELKLDKDNLSLFVKCDICAPNVGSLLTQIPQIAEAQGWTKEEMKHATFIQRNYQGSPALKDGMAQSAAIGGLAIMHPRTQVLLGTVLRDLLQTTANGGEDLDFWIISSTSGGTGEGTHRAVADKIIEVTKDIYFGSKKIKNIRIGKATYTSIGRARSTIQSLLAIAADAKFPEKMRNKYQGNNATFNWYYIDLPDYGNGPETKIPRGRMIALAAKSLMIPELVAPLQLLESNANMAIIRTGYWGHEYDDNDLYVSTLNGFIVKLENMLNPRPEDLVKERSKPEFQPGEIFQALLDKLIDQEKLIDKLNNTNWRLSSENRPKTVNGLELYLNDNITCMNNLYGDFAYRDIQPSPKFVTLVNLNNTQTTVDFGSKSNPAGTKEWYQDYRNAQSVLLWTTNLLGLQITDNPKRPWFTETGLLDHLFKKHDECKKALKGGLIASSADRAKALVKHLRDYAFLLMQCKILFDENTNALKLITAEEKPSMVLNFARTRKAALPSGNTNGSKSAVITANMMDILDHLNVKTWFDIVYETVQRNQIDEFKGQVLKGAVVLTETGLKEVLGLAQNSQIEEIRTELNEHVGRMFNKENQPIEALWMCNQNPHDINYYDEFVFRLLPKLEEGMQEKIGEGGLNGSVSYIYPPLGVLGLYVLALEGLTVATNMDAITTPSFLITPLVPTMHNELTNWAPHQVGVDTPRIKIALAGVVGDPLPREILKAAKLTDIDIKNLSDYYIITDFTEA